MGTFYSTRWGRGERRADDRQTDGRTLEQPKIQIYQEDSREEPVRKEGILSYKGAALSYVTLRIDTRPIETISDSGVTLPGGVV